MRRKAFLGRFAVAGVAYAVTVFLILPIFVVLPVSLTTKTYLSLPEEGVTLDHYGRLFGDPAWLTGLVNSALIATAATAVSVLLGTAFAIGAWRLTGRAMTLLYLMLLAPMILPPIVYSVALFRLWAELRLLDSYPGTIIAHTVLALPLVVIAVGTSLGALDPRIELAARSLGATPLQAVRRVILPNILPGMAAGGLFAFVTSWDEIVVTLFITARHVVTLPRKIWEGVIDAIDPRIAAVGTLLILFTLVLLALDRVLAARRRRA